MSLESAIAQVDMGKYQTETLQKELASVLRMPSIGREFFRILIGVSLAGPVIMMAISWNNPGHVQSLWGIYGLLLFPVLGGAIGLHRAQRRFLLYTAELVDVAFSIIDPMVDDLGSFQEHSPRVVVMKLTALTNATILTPSVEAILQRHRSLLTLPLLWMFRITTATLFRAVDTSILKWAIREDRRVFSEGELALETSQPLATSKVESTWGASTLHKGVKAARTIARSAAKQAKRKAMTPTVLLTAGAAFLVGSAPYYFMA